MFLTTTNKARFGSVFSIVFLTACGSGSHSPAAANTPQPPVASGSYEVVTTIRPETISKYQAIAKVIYDGCVSSAQLSKLSYKPFVTIPASFIRQKDTYISDGKAFYTKTDTWSIDISDTQPDKGCATSIAHTVSTQSVHDGYIYAVDIDKDGHSNSSSPEQYNIAAAAAVDKSAYKLAKAINNVSLGCLDTNDLLAGLATEFCIVKDEAGVALTTFDQQPIPAYVRSLATNDAEGAMLTEPVSAKIGIQVNPSVFSIGVAKQ
ncbi:hypothetical protein [Undibacterium sp. RuTC16W]|uniref:hypothetical protein n=1 Tax=Undibacterium sp. RuTC16W TaxID=3413048 RepID=UPI003BEFE801